MCDTWLAENAGHKKVPKNRHQGTIVLLCWAISLQPRHVSTIGKNLLSSNMSSRCSHTVVNFDPLTAEIGLGVRGTPANFNEFWVLTALLHGSQVVSVSQTLRRWTEGATYVRQGDHHVGHWPTFLVLCLKPTQLICKGSLLEEVEEENQKELGDPGSRGRRPLKQKW